MNDLILGAFIVLAAAPLSFALARIAIRLQQEPGLAALASVLISWQLIALSAGRAPLASSVLLVIAVSGLLLLIQWLQRDAAPGLRVLWALRGLAGFGWALAASFPVLSPGQVLAFSGSLGVAAAGTWCAIRWARSPVSLGKSGLAALGLAGLWLIVRGGASFIAAMD
ncbi:MAG: hypothetical protein ABL951_14625 [Alphaproteobacteria bacterium]